MLSGHLQGKVLAMFCQMIQPGRVLELGTLQASWRLHGEALPDNGVLHTIECDDELEDFILENFAGSVHGKNTFHIGDALTVIGQLDETFDLVFIDANKENIPCLLRSCVAKLKHRRVYTTDNTLWDGKVVQKVVPLTIIKPLK